VCRSNRSLYFLLDLLWLKILLFNLAAPVPVENIESSDI